MAEAAPFEIVGVGQISVRVKDLRRAVAFYRDVLGLRWLFEAPPQLAFFDCGGLRLMLAVPEKAEFDHPGSVLYYRVADIGRSADALRTRGVAFEEDPKKIASLADHDLWLASFRDSEGNLLALMSEVRRGG
ncbi:MAG TPA: VOC family protein [Vicinamibacteria bacterium]|nr:VOC family protein [Vicinamibacteria bacterium]